MIRLSLLFKLCRRRFLVIGIIFASIVFFLGFYSSPNKRSNYREPVNSRHVGSGKKLQQADQMIEAVQFIPGVPGHAYKNVMPKEAPNFSGARSGDPDRAELYAEQARLHSPAQRQQRRLGKKVNLGYQSSSNFQQLPGIVEKGAKVNVYKALDPNQVYAGAYNSRNYVEEAGGSHYGGSNGFSYGGGAADAGYDRDIGQGRIQQVDHGQVQGQYQARQPPSDLSAAGDGQLQKAFAGLNGPVYSNDANNNRNSFQGREHYPALSGDGNVEYEDGAMRNAAPVYYPQQQVGGSEFGYNNGMSNSLAVDRTTEQIYIPPHRIVHFDLKGAPPKMEYLIKVMSIIKELGGTGILLEYEDMFPFKGRLRSATASNHYSEEDIRTLLASARSFGLEVIPLVQTFGHMEFILKLEEFAYLRDSDDGPESICPCHNDTMPLIMDYIDQVMAFHRDARYLHIGCDEVYHLGTCLPCGDRNRNDIFTEHVLKVAGYVKEKYGAKPIIWDDMMRNFMEEEMRPLSSMVEPMVWVYAEDVYRFVPDYTWDRFTHVFPYIWTASAFKGAHGETLAVPPAGRHLVNNLNWLKVMSDQQNKLSGGFRGIVLTGWQRYDHFSVLCELLPSGLPSMALDLVSVTKGFYNQSVIPPLSKALACPDHKQYAGLLDFENDQYLWNTFSWCFFPGSGIFRMTQSLLLLEQEVKEFIATVEKKKGWLTPYSRYHNYSSPYRIDELMSDWSRYQHEVTSLMKNAASALSEVFDHHTEGEWVEQKIYPMYTKLSEIRREADRLKSLRVWPKRPLGVRSSVKQMGIGLSTTTQPPPSSTTTPDTTRPKRRVQAPDLYSSRARLRSLGKQG